MNKLIKFKKYQDSFFRGDGSKSFYSERTYWIKYTTSQRKIIRYGMPKIQFALYKNYNFKNKIWMSHFLQGNSIAVNFSIHSDTEDVLKDNKPFSIIFSEIV